MAVHVPLGNAAILEAQLLMLRIIFLTLPTGHLSRYLSQDMVLGLYYMTKGRKSDETRKVKGEGFSALTGGSYYCL
ncbi:MAG: hypothetical protein R2850_02790 [Bacteroidia bacterium]